MESFLSPRLKRLICDAGVTGATLPAALTGAGLLDWTTIRTLLTPERETPEYYEENTVSLAPVFKTVQTHFETAEGRRQFMKTFEELTQWTSAPNLAWSLAEQLLSYSPGEGARVLEWLLMCLPLLERSLGDVYLCRGRQCPSMLKDLLQTAELRELLSPTVMQFLRVLIGPPISLNLRNVVWHGFPVPGEIPFQYACVILTLFPSIGKLLEENSILPHQIPHREYLVFRGFLVENSTRFNAADEESFERWIEDSDVVAPSMKPMWRLALQRYRAQQYGVCICILLPQLEHALRCRFAEVNHCPERVVTAETAEFFTTFDEMLVRTLPDGRENRLQGALLSLLMDLLQYPDGPRVRDRLSHGEADVTGFPRELAGEVLAASCALLSREAAPASWGRRYEVRFHPVSLLKRAILDAASSLNDWISLPHPPPDDTECTCTWSDDQTFPEVTQCLEQSVTHVMELFPVSVAPSGVTVFGTSFAETVERVVATAEIQTLFRSP